MNYSYFETIDNENKAYWLGFLYGDGCVYIKGTNYYIKIGLKDTDINHLEKFKGCLSSNHKIYKIKQNYGKSCVFQIGSKKMCNDLIKLGCVPRKSTKDLHIPDIKKELIRHFIRGLFDADGSIYLHKDKKLVTEITNNKLLLQEILNFLISNNILKSTKKLNIYKKKYYRLRTYGNDSLKILHYIYDNCNVYLERKYNLFKV